MTVGVMIVRFGLIILAALSVNSRDYGWATFFGLTALTLWVDE